MNQFDNVHLAIGKVECSWGKREAENENEWKTDPRECEMSVDHGGSLLFVARVSRDEHRRERLHPVRLTRVALEMERRTAAPTRREMLQS